MGIAPTPVISPGTIQPRIIKVMFIFSPAFYYNIKFKIFTPPKKHAKRANFLHIYNL